MIIFQKIKNFSEITSKNCKSKQFWLLQCDGQRYFFNNPNGEFTKDLYNKFKGFVYWYSPMEFEFSCSLKDLSHEDSPTGISGEFVISAKLLPAGFGFADWVVAGNIEELTDDMIKEYFQSRPDIFRPFIQRLLEDKSLGDLMQNHGEELAFHSSNNLSWLLITAVRVKHLSQEISDVQKRINAYNSWMTEQEEKLQYAQQQLEYEVSWANIETAREEMARRRELAEQAHRYNMENAKCEQELRLLQYQLDEKNKKELSDLQEAEIKAKIKKLQLELDEYKVNIALTAKRIKKQDAQIKLIEIRSAQAAIEQEEAVLRRDIAAEELRVLKLAETRYCDEIELLQHCIDQGEKNASSIREAITQGNKDVVENIKETIIQMQQDFDKKLGDLLSKFSESMSMRYFVAPPTLIHVVREQRKNNKIHLAKEAAVQKDSFIQTRDVVLPVMHSMVKIGSSMKFSLVSNISGFITIICFGTSGLVQLLEPNSIDSSDGLLKIESGKKYTFPGDKFLSEYVTAGLTQAGPPGNEQLLVIVSQYSLEDVFYEQDENEVFAGVTSDQLSLLSQKLVSLPQDSWAAGYLSYKVVS